MATCDVIDVQALLGRFVVLTEVVAGFEFERRGQVIGVVMAHPGSCCDESFLLERDDGACEFYSPGDVTICSVI